MKKFISILILTITVVQMLALPVFAKENNNTEYWITMQGFKVVGEDEDKNSGFTIADMSKMFYQLLNVKEAAEPEATRQIYVDVDRWHWAAGYIEWLYNNKVYTGDGSGVFEPDKAAKLSDVCTVALNLLGYTNLMENINDNTDVIKKAAQIGLLSSKVSRAEHEVTYNEFASICYELLFTDIVEPILSTKKGFVYGEEFITEVLDIEYNKGIILGANGYSLTNDYCGIDEVIIDGIRLETTANAGYSDYIGYRVKYYYDSEEEVLIVAVPFQNEELIIKSEDIVSYQNNTYSYEKNKRIKKEKCEDVLLLYNGKITTNRDAFIPEYGQVRLIDNDSDGNFECVISENAVNIILEKVIDGTIYGKNADANGKKYTIDTTELDVVKYLGNSVPVEDLKENTVISAVISEDGKCGTFYVSENKITGILDKVYNEKIFVDNVEYLQASNMYNPNLISLPGSSVEIRIDVYGNVAFIIASDENKYVFGYLISVKENPVEERLILRILTAEGGILKLYTASKLSIDGTKVQDLDEAKRKLAVNEVIRYRLLNGEIRHIDIAKRNSGFSSFRIGSYLDSLTLIAEGSNMLYKSSPEIFKYYGTAMDVHAEFAVDEDTIVFFVPTEAEYRNDYDYYVGDKSSLRNDLVADVQAYVTSNNALFAKAVVVRYTTQVLLATQFTIVDKITITLNEDDEVVGRIHGFSNGSEVDVEVPDLSLLTDIDSGSIIRYQANKDGEVKSINNIYGCNGTGNVNTSATHSWTSGSSGVNANVRVVVGYVQEKSGTVARFKFKDNASQDELFNLKNCNIYVYDEYDEKRLRIGTVDDLRDYAHYGAASDEVIICTRAANVSDVFLIRR